MGYITKDIAIIDEPKIVSLAGAPNFVTFASKAAAKTYIDVDIKINVTQATPDIPVRTVLRVYEAGGTLHEFHGTADPDEVGGSVFYVSTDPADTAENLREALVANAWINANFEVRIPSSWTGGNVANGDTVNIKGKGAGADFRLNITAPNNVASSAYAITWTSNNSTDGDTLKGNASTVEVELDIYENPDTFLGGDDRPLDEAKLGSRTITMQKTYAGAPIWFDVNGPFSKYGGYNLPASAGWFDTGTAKAFRFIAKIRSVNSFNFYQSNTLFAINGFSRLSQPVDMTEYVYGDGPFKLLTAAPTVPYVKGQKAYLNFIYSDAQRGQPSPTYPQITVAYRAFSRAGNYLGSLQRQATTGASLSVVNSVVLELDTVLGAYPLAGEIRAGIAQDGVTVSNEMSFHILPECLHDLQQFTFLNKWGGWEVFNFDAGQRQEVRRSSENYFKTTTPDSVGGPEHTYRVDIDEAFTVEGAPVTDEVAEWLKEFAGSPVVLDAQGRFVLIEDFTLNISDASENMHVPVLKYRLNDTFTND